LAQAAGGTANHDRSAACARRSGGQAWSRSTSKSLVVGAQHNVKQTRASQTGWAGHGYCSRRCSLPRRLLRRLSVAPPALLRTRRPRPRTTPSAITPRRPSSPPRRTSSRRPLQDGEADSWTLLVRPSRGCRPGRLSVAGASRQSLERLPGSRRRSEIPLDCCFAGQPAPADDVYGLPLSGRLVGGAALRISSATETASWRERTFSLRRMFLT
jgi:hypothetical protein